MKKRFLSILLVISFVFASCMFFVGCGRDKGEDQLKLHEKFCLATSSINANNQTITYSYKKDNELNRQATYNNLTKEFAYIRYNNGIVYNYEVIKSFDNDIAYFSNSEEKIVDASFVEKLASDRIFVNIPEQINLDYAQYKAHLDSQVAETKTVFANEGYVVTNGYYTLEYKTLSDNKYNSTVKFFYEYENMKSGFGTKHKYQKTISTDFSNDWVFTIKESSVREQSQYDHNEVIGVESKNFEHVHNFSSTFDNQIYSTIDLHNKELPAQAEEASLVLVFGQTASSVLNVPFNVNILDYAKSFKQPEFGRTYEFYLDEGYTSLMPNDYKLNTQTNNILYVKDAIEEGYTQVIEIYQDSQGIRGERSRIIRLNSEIELNKVYDGKTFDGKIYVDEKYTIASEYKFTKGDSHTILYIVDYNVDIVTEYSLTFKLKGVYYEIPKGTPSEQTLEQYFDKIELKFYGIYVTNSAFSLEIKNYDNVTCSLDYSLKDIQAGTYTINSTIKAGYVVVEGQFGKHVSQVNEENLVFKFNKNQKLKISVNGSTYNFNDVAWSTKVGIFRYLVEDPDGNHIVTLGSFKEDVAYYIYIV